MPEVINSENTSPESLVAPELPIVTDIRTIIEDPGLTPEMRENLLIYINERLSLAKKQIEGFSAWIALCDLGILDFDEWDSQHLQRFLNNVSAQLDGNLNL